MGKFYSAFKLLSTSNGSSQVLDSCRGSSDSLLCGRHFRPRPLTVEHGTPLAIQADPTSSTKQFPVQRESRTSVFQSIPSQERFYATIETFIAIVKNHPHFRFPHSLTLHSSNRQQSKLSALREELKGSSKRATAHRDPTSASSENTHFNQGPAR